MNATRLGESLVELEARIAMLPFALRIAANVPLPELDARRIERFVTTGIGASEGPARALAALIAHGGGPSAFFAPLSTFAYAPPAGDVLVVFSQGVSPNARLALDAHARYRRVVLVTSVTFSHPSHAEDAAAARLYVEALERRGVDVVRVPPAHENGMLVRVVGPTVAMLVAIRLAARFGAANLESVDAHEAADAYSAVQRVASLPDDRVHLVAAGLSPELVVGHRSKLLEGFFLPPPSIFDVLDVVHGPFQVLFERGCTFLVLGTPRARTLVDRFESMVAPTSHALVRIEATRDDPLAYFEHAAALDGLLLRALHARPRNLFDWPGRGVDSPLYDLGN